MTVLETEWQIEAAVTELVRLEPRFAEVVAAHGLPPLRRMPGGLGGLLRIVTDQMISLQAGEAIWRRIEDRCAPLGAASILRRRQSTLMKLGLSGAKARTFRAVAAAVADRSLDFDRLHLAPDAEVLRILTALPGIGPWTADIYLLAAMGRADAWPAGDLALQAAAQHLFDLPQRPSAETLTRLAAAWRPWRAVAARLLWSHYRGFRGLPQKA